MNHFILWVLLIKTLFTIYHFRCDTLSYKSTKIGSLWYRYTQLHPYEYLHTHTHTHIYTHTYTHIYTHIHTYLHTHTHTYKHTHICTHSFTHTRKLTHTHTHLHMHEPLHTQYTHTYPTFNTPSWWRLRLPCFFSKRDKSRLPPPPPPKKGEIRRYDTKLHLV